MIIDGASSSADTCNRSAAKGDTKSTLDRLSNIQRLGMEACSGSHHIIATDDCLQGNAFLARWSCGAAAAPLAIFPSFLLD